MTKQMSKIISCDAEECAYNINKQCHTLAITIGDGETPCCDTAIKSAQKGGISDMTGGVGACKVHVCEYNDNLECNADGIKVDMHSECPACGTFEHK